tara:strand:- start:1469 stop:2503 length:1035 start_codon:yes stop_codon:yes gene_type:complete
MIIEKHKGKDGVMVYIVDKNMTDTEADKLKGTELKRSMIKFIIKEDADVYNKDNLLLLRFRKNALGKKNTDMFYDNVKEFAQNITTNRGIASGSEKKKGNKEKVKIMANILGYMDGFSPSQKIAMKQKDLMTKLNVRESRFNIAFPDKWEKAQPLIRDIDRLYKKYCPGHYRKQRAKADETFYRIKDTAFTTITVNINFKTHVHQDKGDDTDGFGNLVVIEGEGSYTGSETCFPQYGIGVDVRTGDVAFMNVHEWHANLPLKLKTKDSKRMAIVSYLRTKIWEKTKGLTKKRVRDHDDKVRKLSGSDPRPKTPRRTVKQKGKSKKTKKQQNKRRKNKTKRSWLI